MARLLLTSTVWWPSIAVLAVSFEQAGFETTVLCPKGHPAWAAPISGCLRLPARRPLAALARAILATDPVLIVPADDRSVAYLHALHGSGDASIRARVERSLGAPSTFATASSRVALLAAAREVGMPTPMDQAIAGPADLERFLGRVPGPWVLKVDGVSGGQGVRVVRTPEAARSAYRALAGKWLPVFAIKRWLINRDPFWLTDWHSGPGPEVSVQSYVPGRPGNLALFCRQGEIMGATIAEAESCSYETGPSTFVRIVERTAFLEQARRLVERLRLSGFIGLDFMVDTATGTAVLIEMNPRITALCNMRPGFGIDPISAAASAILKAPPTPVPGSSARTLRAHFPLAWLAHPGDPRLALCRDDIPETDQAFLAEALKLPWDRRGLLARGYARIAGQGGG